MEKKPQKILILGSGALKIGQAGEFDYSGSQAIKAFKEEGIKTVLINPNIATIQTSEQMADEVYFLPVTDYFVEEVIKKEKPDSIALSFGGQTALNCGVSLYKKGILEKYNVKVLGTPVEAIILTEDRELFANHLRKIGISTPQSHAVETLEDAKKTALEIGYPVMVRAAFALGGQSSGVVSTEEELTALVTEAFSFTHQVLVEKYLHHFKEIEYEVVRDSADNCITVCNMENMDPLGIHTGESIVVAPSQTLTNFEYHFLREKAIEIVRSLGIVGECNVQYALNPKPEHNNDGQTIDYYVIEVNARLSRSSALASKATGYPLAYVAAKLALGQQTTEVKNQVTQITQSCFEPALDYLVIKVPRWDLEKFTGVKEKLGSSMKSVGEVMAIGRTFEEALQKAVRMLDIGVEGITDSLFVEHDRKYLEHIGTATPRRVFALAEGLRKGMSVEEMHNLTGIDNWFLYRVKNIVDHEKELAHSVIPAKAGIQETGSPVLSGKTRQPRDDSRSILDKEFLLKLKQLGFSDKRIGTVIGKTGLEVRKIRKELHVVPAVFAIDTLAGEVPAKTNYLYMTYNGFHNDVAPIGNTAVVVLGSGPYRIGSSVEFDWTCVNTALSLKKYDKKSVIINCNPETVSTDYDMTDRLYFEELSFERVADIYEYENPQGIIVSVGGQRPNTLAKSLSSYGFTILGTQAQNIDMAEDRNKFSALLDELHVQQPAWNKFSTIEEATSFADKIGYPVLIRPSYVLSGSAMKVCYNENELIKYIKKASDISSEYPVTVSQFMTLSRELEFDGVAQNGDVKVYAVAEHIEHAGVHSGDATIVFPTQRTYVQTERQVIDIAHKIAKALQITGPFNIQFIAKESKVFVIEANLRASRTLPLISKATHVNFAKVFVDSLFGESNKIDIKYPDYVIVKSPQFSFSRLEGADPVLHVEMASTGEVACFGDDVEEAFLKSILATKSEMKGKAALLSLGGMTNKKGFLDFAETLHTLGFTIFATEKTAEYLKVHAIPVETVNKVYSGKRPHVVDLIQQKKVSVVVNISEPEEEGKVHLTEHLSDGFLIRRAAIDNNIPLFTDINAAKAFVRSIEMYPIEKLKIKPWSEYK